MSLTTGARAPKRPRTGDELELLLVCYLITSALSAMSVFASL